MANFGDIGSSLAIAAGQAVRRNAGNTAFEAYTPGIAVGQAVSGGGANRVLFEDSSQNLAASSSLTFGSSLLSAPKAKLLPGAYNDTALEIQATGIGFAGNLFYAHSDDAGGGSFKIDYSGACFLNGATGTATVNLADNGYAKSAIRAVQSSGNVNDLVVLAAGTGGVGGTLLSCTDSSGGPLFAVAANGSGVGVGSSSPSAGLHVIRTTEQARFGYDASNYLKLTVGSTGTATLDGAGTAKGVAFASGMKLGFFGTAPIAQPGASNDVNASIGTGYGVTDDTLFTGGTGSAQYTIGGIVRRLKELGLIAS